MRAASPLLGMALLIGCTAPSGAHPGADPTTMPDIDTWPHRTGAGGFDALDVDAIWSPGDLVRYWVEASDHGARRSWTLEFALPTVPGADADARFGDVGSGFVRMRNATSQTLGDDVNKGLYTRYCRYPVDVRVRLERHEDRETFTTDITTQVQAHVWQQRVDADPDLGIQFLFGVLIKVDRLLRRRSAVSPRSGCRRPSTPTISRPSLVGMHLERLGFEPGPYRPENLVDREARRP